MRSRVPPLITLSLALLLAGACERPPHLVPDQASEAGVASADVEQAVNEAFRRIYAYADSLDAQLHPVPLLTLRQEAMLQQYSNEQQLEQARRLGISPPLDAATLGRLQREGRLVRLEESNAYWIVRELEYSDNLVTPDVRALLTEIATRFQTRIGQLGLPPLRLEVTSILRTSETQQALRRGNPNATSGTSTHEFGTTIDVAYSSFKAPAQPVHSISVPLARWMEPHLYRFEEAMIETVAARRSRELQAILGHVLLAMQSEGKVMVTLERQQPVYHMTVARRF